MNDVTKMPIIGRVTTKPLTYNVNFGDRTEVFDMPSETYSVVHIFQDDGQKTYVTNIWHKEYKRAPLLITENLVDYYEPIAADGKNIPERYRNLGFTKVGQKKKSTRPEKKWMVLARKGDKYKVVHGGYKGMQDYSQHHDDVRRKRFWNRMGGFDSEKANDPFSPLYWHKKFGTWEDGGPIYDNGGLTPELYKIVRSQEFKSWFGDWENSPETASKAVDENGEPAIYYHGSSDKDITIFDRRKSKSRENTIGQFIYFSKEKQYSSQERFIGQNGMVYEVFLNARNPLNIFDEVSATDVSRFFRFTGAENKPESFSLKWRGDWSSAFEEILSENENPDLATAVMKFGYDSVYYHNSAGDEMLAIINSNQIKLIDNKTFDPNNPDIRAKDGANIKDATHLKDRFYLFIGHGGSNGVLWFEKDGNGWNFDITDECPLDMDLIFSIPTGNFPNMTLEEIKNELSKDFEFVEIIEYSEIGQYCNRA